MKALLALALMMGVAFTAQAETAQKDKARVAKAKPTTSRTEIKSKANNMAAGIQAAEAALTPEEIAVAERVHTGRIACELGAYVTVAADPRSPGYFDISGKGFKYRMFPVESRTGAIRLEDQRAGAVWLQIANKSMLMDQKRGQRLADDCMSPEQVAVAETLKKAPAPNLLEPSPTK